MAGTENEQKKSMRREIKEIVKKTKCCLLEYELCKGCFVLNKRNLLEVVNI